ncbi:MAG: ribosome recycling factor [bacterium]|nr:ribosome recycling factor [bacterium]
MFSIENFRAALKPITDSLTKEFAGIRTGRPSPGLVEDLRVMYYGELLPLKQVASVGVMPPRDIVIQAWDKEAIPGIIKAIETSSLHVSATADGLTVRVRLPELSEERREELVKHTKRLAEDHRIQIRHARDEANKSVQQGFSDGEVPEDRKFMFKDQIQEAVDTANKLIDSLVEKKEGEIRE